MSHTVVPVNIIDTDAVVRAVDGELWSDVSGPAPYGALVQKLVNNDYALSLGMAGQMAGGERMSVDPGGTSTVFTVRVSPIRSALIKDAANSVWRGVSLGAQALGLSATVGPLAALAPNTWYYVTLAVEAGVPRLYINVFGPDASGLWESVSPDTFRYIGCFRTDASGAPLAVQMHRGRYTYPVNTHLRVLSGGTDTSATSVPVATAVPPHAVNGSARLLVYGSVSSGSGNARVMVGVSGANKQLYMNSDGDHAFEVACPLAGGGFEYLVSGTGTVQADIYVVGFEEG